MLSHPPNRMEKLVASYITKFGTAHVGLQVGDKMIEWFDDELVSVRDLRGRRAVAVFDLHAGWKAAEAEPKLRLLCDAIRHWNVTMKYDNLTSSLGEMNRAGMGSCQGFVAWVINHLGIRWDLWEGEAGRFFDNYRSNPTNWHESVICGGLRVPCSNHADFDFWVRTNYSPLKSWIGREGEYDLLKAIDRGFWFRYFGCEESLKRELKADDRTLFGNELKRCTHNTGEGCPFSKPDPLSDADEKRALIRPGSVAAAAAAAAARAVAAAPEPVVDARVVIPDAAAASPGIGPSAGALVRAPSAPASGAPPPPV